MKKFHDLFIIFLLLGIQKFPSKKRKSKQTASQRNEKTQNIRKKIRGKLLAKKEKMTNVEDDELKIESSSISTSPTKFNSLPEYPSSIHTHWKDPKYLVEEEGLEVSLLYMEHTSFWIVFLLFVFLILN